MCPDKRSPKRKGHVSRSPQFQQCVLMLGPDIYAQPQDTMQAYRSFREYGDLLKAIMGLRWASLTSKRPSQNKYPPHPAQVLE